MIIRDYKEKDFKKVVQLIQNIQETDCWPEVYPMGWSEKKVKNEFAPIAKYQSPLFLIAEENNKLVGLIAGHEFMEFAQHELPHIENKFATYGIFHYYQRDIIIHPNFQGRTTAPRLNKKLESHAKNCGYHKIITRTPPQNQKGIKFFNRLGYKESLRDTNPERIYFIKDL